MGFIQVGMQAMCLQSQDTAKDALCVVFARVVLCCAWALQQHQAYSSVAALHHARCSTVCICPCYLNEVSFESFRKDCQVPWCCLHVAFVCVWGGVLPWQFGNRGRSVLLVDQQCHTQSPPVFGLRVGCVNARCTLQGPRHHVLQLRHLCGPSDDMYAVAGACHLGLLQAMCLDCVYAGNTVFWCQHHGCVSAR
jgi:hypothetical protein